MRDRLGIIASLRDVNGRQLLNTRVPWGTPLPGSNVPEPAPAVWETGRPVVSGLFVGAVAEAPLFAVQLPVRLPQTGAARNVLSLSLPAERMRAILAEQRLPAGWVLAVVDESGAILARNQRHEEFVGRQATRDLQENALSRDGTWTGSTVDGLAVFGAYARSELAPWNVAVGAPERDLRTPIWRTIGVVVAAAAGVAVLSLLAAFHSGRRIAAPLQALADRAAALGRGAEVGEVETTIREVREVGDMLVATSLLLRERERELRSVNAALEGRVAERTRDLEASNARLLAEASERQNAEAQLRQSQKMEAVGRLTGGVAHDFNNLLTVVLGNLSIARRRLGTSGADERIRRALDGASEGAQRAAELTRRLLAFARQQPLAPEAVDANRLVVSMSDLLRRTLGEDIHIETVLAGGLWRAQADPNQLENAVLNLAVNSRDAMPDGGKLTIETANAYLDEVYAASREDVRPGQYIMISVSDTGSGMPAEVVAKAFDPFFTTKPVGKGTGLGLSQVYGFAKQSGGHAAIYSEPGQGTTVKLYLPKLRSGQLEMVPAEHRSPMGALAADGPLGRGEMVLVAEDDAMVRDFAVASLEEGGYRVVAAEDGPSALALLDAHPEVRLLFTDVVLTGPMNGRALADAMLARRSDIGVLFTTGYTRNAIIHHGRLDEGVNFLGKPYSAADLVVRVRQILDSSGR